MNVRRLAVCTLAVVLTLAANVVSGPARATAAEKESAEELRRFEEATRDVPKPRELWPLVKQDMVAMDLKIVSDEIVPSDTDPSQRLRKITAYFHSIELEGKKWGHPCVILAPADPARNADPKRAGKVVIVACPNAFTIAPHVAKYGEPIAARTGYPTMVLTSPGEYPDGTDIERDIQVLDRMRRATGKNYYNMNCQLAVVYIQAMNVMQEVLGIEDLKAVIGGHSKRGRSAPVAAAMDPRVASAIVMGNEGVYDRRQPPWHLSFHYDFFEDQVNVPVFYIGATNEGGYKMFNVNIMQERLKRPMTIEMIPNYHHWNYSEIQYMDFAMWVAHVFDGRPISKIVEVSHERKADRSIFRAKIESEAKIQIVRIWFVYTDNAEWRDLMWYEWTMHEVGDHYEVPVFGAAPDAFMVEVGDTAMGFPGYVSSLPQKLTDAPVVERAPNRGMPRHWRPASKSAAKGS